MDITAGIVDSKSTRPPRRRWAGRQAVLAGALALALVAGVVGPFTAGSAYAGPPAPSEPSNSDNQTPNDSNQPDDSIRELLAPLFGDLIGDPSFGGPVESGSGLSSGQ